MTSASNNIQEACALLMQNIFYRNIESQNIAFSNEYERFYKQELSRTHYATSLPRHYGAPASQNDTNDIVTLCKWLKDHTKAYRPDVREYISAQSGFKDANATTLNNHIDFTLRLMLMMNIRQQEARLQMPETPILRWNDSTSLEDFIAQHFPRSNWQITPRECCLDPWFTVANMVRICQLRIRWTDSLENHLRLDRRSRVLSIFPYKACLSAYLEGSRMSGDE